MALGLLGCEADAWLRIVGVPAFREIDTAEARRLLEDPEVSVVQVRSRFEPLLPMALLVNEGDRTLEGQLAGATRVLVVSTRGEAGRRLSARLVRAGTAQVMLRVGDPAELQPGPTHARAPSPAAELPRSEN